MAEPITTESMAIAPGVRETASEDGAVLLDVEQGICFSLNPVGLKIWELLKQRYSIDQMVDSLGHDFPVSAAELRSDVVDFLQALKTKRLIRPTGYTAPRRSWLSKLFRSKNECAATH